MIGRQGWSRLTIIYPLAPPLPTSLHQRPDRTNLAWVDTHQRPQESNRRLGDWLSNSYRSPVAEQRLQIQDYATKVVRSGGTSDVAYSARHARTADGFKVDVDGNLCCSWGMSEELDGVVVLSPEGKLIGRIRPPVRRANVVLGGEKRNRLFMTANQSLYAL